MKNKATRQASKCTYSLAEKSQFIKERSNKKLVGTRLILNFSYLKHKSL